MSTAPSPFDRTDLWAKAKNFINRSFDARDADDFATAAMWAACALELLGKAALSYRNPCLIADPSDDGKSLLIAAGLSSDYPKAKSIPAKAVFARCKAAFQPFNADEADRIAKARNEELHSGLLPFDSVLNQNVWWERFWAQAIILIEAQDEDIDSFVGAGRSSIAQKHLDSNVDHVKQHTARRIAEAVQRWAVAQTSMDAASSLETYLRRLPTVLAEYSSSVTCPACEQSGLLLGEDVASSEVEVDHGTGDAWEIVAVYPDAFRCGHCGLALDGSPYLDAAGLDELISSEREYEPIWDDYGND